MQHYVITVIKGGITTHIIVRGNKVNDYAFICSIKVTGNEKLLEFFKLSNPYLVVDINTGIYICSDKNKKLCLNKYEELFKDRHFKLIELGYNKRLNEVIKLTDKFKKEHRL